MRCERTASALWHDPEVVVFQGRSAGFGAFFHQRLEHGRAYGRQRGARFGAGRNAAGVALAVVVPFVLAVADRPRGLLPRPLSHATRRRPARAPRLRRRLGGRRGHGPSGHVARPMSAAGTDGGQTGVRPGPEQGQAGVTPGPGPGLSVVIASVNGMPYLGECLDALAERCPEAEVVVADWTDEADARRGARALAVREAARPSTSRWRSPSSARPGSSPPPRPVVALIEDHCLVTPAWAARLVAGARSRPRRRRRADPQRRHPADPRLGGVLLRVQRGHGADAARPGRGPPRDERLVRPRGARRDRRSPARGPLGELAPPAAPGARLRALVRARRRRRARQGLRPRRVRLAALPLLARRTRACGTPSSARAACSTRSGRRCSCRSSTGGWRATSSRAAATRTRVPAGDAAVLLYVDRLGVRRGGRLRCSAADAACSGCGDEDRRRRDELGQPARLRALRPQRADAARRARRRRDVRVRDRRGDRASAELPAGRRDGVPSRSSRDLRRPRPADSRPPRPPICCASAPPSRARASTRSSSRPSTRTSRRSALPSVVGIHDLIADDFPELTLPTRRARRSGREAAARAAARAARLFTVSELRARALASARASRGADRRRARGA